MTDLAAIEDLCIGELRARTEEARVVLEGVISMRNPGETLTPYLRRVHDAIVRAGLPEVAVDITGLRFMNSSSIRALVDWVQWIRREPTGSRYVLHFRSAKGVSWQATTLGAIEALGEGSVRITEAG